MSDFLSRLREKMTGMSDNIDRARGWSPQYRPRREPTRSVVKHTRFDTQDYKQYCRDDKDVDNGITELFVGDEKMGRVGYDNAPELVEDIFYAFLKPQPTTNEVVEVKKDARLNGKFVEQMMDLPEYQRLHDQTMTDPVLATMAVGAVMDTLKDLIVQHRELVEDSNRRKREEFESDKPVNTGGDNPPQPPGKKYRHGADQPPDQNGEGCGGEQQKKWDEGEYKDEPPKPQGGGGKGKGDKSDDPSDQDSKGGGNGDGDEMLDGEQRQFDENYREHAGQATDTDLSQMQDIDMDDLALQELLEGADFAKLNAAMAEAAQQAEELESMRKSVGLSPAEWRQTDPKARLAIAAKLNTPQMRKLAEVIGRMKRYAMGQQAIKIIDGPHEIVDVEMGADLRKVVRSEFALLGHPKTKIEFYRKFAARELLQFREEGVEMVGKGPMVICVDNSGSMSGDPENWAKGVCEAIRRIAQEQKRDVHIIFFETNHHRERFTFLNGEGRIDDILKMLSITAGGGTEFDGVLTEALGKAVEAFEGEGKGKADIVFVTDGEAFLDEGWIEKFVEEKERVGVRIFSVYVSGAYDQRYSEGPMGLLRKFSDHVINVNDLRPESVGDIFQKI